MSIIEFKFPQTIDISIYRLAISLCSGNLPGCDIHPLQDKYFLEAPGLLNYTSRDSLIGTPVTFATQIHKWYIIHLSPSGSRQKDDNSNLIKDILKTHQGMKAGISEDIATSTLVNPE